MSPPTVQEWLWPVGWLLRAQLAIAPKVGGTEELTRTIGHVKSLMANHLTHLLTSPWRSLPELTNAEGSICRDSNPAQSWSTGCLLEASAIAPENVKLKLLCKGTVVKTKIQLRHPF